MKSIQSGSSVRVSEQTEGKKDRNPRTSLIKQALFRDQVQAAIADLIRDYEVASGLSVIRVEYKVEETCKKIYAIPDLDNFLADRLREGK